MSKNQDEKKHRKRIENAEKKSKLCDIKHHALTFNNHLCRLGLSSIVDLSSEFSGGMCSWFGEEWPDLKAKALSQINIKPKKFGSAIESDINRIEEFCSEYKYWKARDFVLEMFLTDPFIFVDKEGNKQNLTEIEFVLKVAGPIIDIIFSDVQHLVQLKWGEMVSKATAVGRKIDLQVTCRGKNQGKIVELSHSECACRTTPTKIISDRSKCLRTNKSVLDKYLSHDLSDEMIKNSAVIGLQLAALYGQIIGVDLLDHGLYFGFEGPLLRYPAQINDIAVLKQTLEALYFFKKMSDTQSTIDFQVTSEFINIIFGTTLCSPEACCICGMQRHGILKSGSNTGIDKNENLFQHRLNHLPVVENKIKTPTGSEFEGAAFKGKICGVSIMRAGEAMEQGLRECCRSVRIGKILIQRDEETAKPQLYYAKLPPDISSRYVLLLDPMLATGGSALKAIEVLLEYGVLEDKILFLNLLCCPEGIKAVTEKYKKLKIITSFIDQGLDEKKYIIPGIGDFGDRYFTLP
ncbi:5834_t:CDS:10 [Entrophospora sp. SA101]|nr:5834_t:CDS:10 [Entrophospora sp. SA101]